MKKIILLFIPSAFLITMGHVDFWNGQFLLRGTQFDLQIDRYLILTIVFAGISALLLPKKHCCYLFGSLSFLSTIDSMIWFPMVQYVVEDSIPIWGSMPLFIMAFQKYMDSMGNSAIFLNIVLSAAVFLFYIFIMVITQKVKIFIQAVIEGMKEE